MYNNIKKNRVKQNIIPDDIVFIFTAGTATGFLSLSTLEEGLQHVQKVLSKFFKYIIY